MLASKTASTLPTNTKNEPCYQPTIPSWYNATWHSDVNALNLCSRIHNDYKKQICGLANLVHADGTDTDLCYAHSIGGKLKTITTTHFGTGNNTVPSGK